MATTSDNIRYSCHAAAFREGEQFVHSHSLSMVISGEMELNDGTNRHIFRKGDLYFARKKQLLKFIKKPLENEEFKSISILFEEELLNNFSIENKITIDPKRHDTAYILLSDSGHLHYFMESLLQYQDLLEDKAPAFITLKQKEALTLLLAYNPRLKDTLFDFTEPHKIDLETFMHKNYHFNVKIERFAYLTGRSLATFKRDFQKIFQTSPRNWLQQRRLTEAYYLIEQQHKKPSEVYLDLGFEDLSHFSFAFKKQFGITPTALLK
ncbi:helix-turn-helix transcriptional regulator [Flavobacterium supellecticarium]|uniref:Helix-turn-helix transcriptional regulator n=1 Tax=Flavobacterium supellecticarium TaxID=2565924 RepID=A0A4S4A0H6_9FLAO|nr:AraC family transcriptional regulator [Flavobacterium supellecticarium]THF51758.1 helix-turn-helix transcriptional regulator [Flavobacterium supellecticarium]